MKKLLLLVCAAVMSLSASAQAGDKALGAQLVFGSETNNIGLGVKGQYYFTDQLRGEASVDYFFKNKGVSMWDINANVHYLFDVADKFKVYPLAGLGYTNWSYKLEYDNVTLAKGTDGRLAVNLGGGAEYELTKDLSVNAELKYQIINNYNQLVLGVGVAYKF
ncbi:porin family protein [Prevotella melaninogenica]|uniref:porin family protein n=1 Tax=Prevotella melaninogenica TaxID=28132 RepID=UPI001C5D9FD6|nr:porin family protein [Prevotella melaninogenica]MBW4728896.1 porin family protein [Prevotella melaninogenica]MBW4731655.1 porin family protein [Prevotella melaninogenica]MBW4749718.1 porin family protein [Prevotella melaninogenica]